MNSKNRDSCRELFKNLKILPLHLQYIFSLLIFVVKNKDHIKNQFKIFITLILDITLTFTLQYQI